MAECNMPTDSSDIKFDISSHDDVTASYEQLVSSNSDDSNCYFHIVTEDTYEYIDEQAAVGDSEPAETSHTAGAGFVAVSAGTPVIANDVTPSPSPRRRPFCANTFTTAGVIDSAPPPLPSSRPHGAAFAKSGYIASAQPSQDLDVSLSLNAHR